MAECKDCVRNKVCSEVNSLKCRQDFIWYDAQSGCPYYSADVVPKSEYDRLEKLFNDMTQEAKGYLNRLYGIRADVAREIFEDIAQISCRISESDGDGNMRILCYQLSSEKLAELKKKYTEGKK